MEKTAYEHSGERSDNPSMASRMGLKTALHTMDELCPSGDWADWECFWWKMVKEYTASKLTFDSDKWTAFSGLAKAVEQHTRTRLYHGLWESNIFDELLWKVLEPGRRVDYDAPSWSWLSVDAGVHGQRYNYKMDFRQAATVSIPHPMEQSQPTIRITPKNFPSEDDSSGSLRAWHISALGKKNTNSGSTTVGKCTKCTPMADGNQMLYRWTRVGSCRFCSS